LRASPARGRRRTGEPGDRMCYMTRMLDPYVIPDLNRIMPPNPPAIVQERLWLDPLGEAMERRAAAVVASYTAQISDWAAHLDMTQAMLANIEVPATEREIVAFTKLIEDTEALAEFRATETRRVRKTATRSVKQAFKISPSAGAVLRGLAAKLIAEDERIIERLLDLALSFRAFRAALMPESKGGPSFSDPAEMERYLAKAMA
jgi:hypothetical protein